MTPQQAPAPAKLQGREHAAPESAQDDHAKTTSRASRRTPGSYRVPPRWILLLLALGAVLALWPLWVPLVLASWGSMLAKPLHDRLSGKMGGSGRAAGVVTVVLALFLLVPLVLLGLAIAGAVADLTAEVRQASDVRDAIGMLLSGTDGDTAAPGADDQQQWLTLLERHGGGAMAAVEKAFGALTTFGIFVVVFVFGFYTFLVHGRAGYAWFLEHAPLPRQYMASLGAAFEETGRGLLVGFGLTSLVQGTIAGIAYAVIGVPQAVLLGVLTAVASWLPAIGTGFVWGPVAVALLLDGQTGATLAVLITGAVVASVDNLLRPMLTRYGELQLPTFVVLVSMLGGVMMFGASGILLGPICVRLLLEGLRMSRNPASAPPPAPTHGAQPRGQTY